MIIQALLALTVVATATPAEEFVATAKQAHGDEGEKAARFLVENMPRQDQDTLSSGFLEENLELALKARAKHPWSKAVPDEIFLNDVLPYAVLDEPRDPWRKEFRDKAGEIVKDAKSITEAAQALNKEFFKTVNVHYNTGRKRANQSPKESMQSGIATCTGLSIILVDACRSVGIPARAVGTPMWSNGLGNHTWVEVWDGGWHFTGADEYDAGGLDRGWFVNDAAKAQADVPQNAVYATSWKRTELAFPMAWSVESRTVSALNVTAIYVKQSVSTDLVRLGVRLFDRAGGLRIVAKVAVLDENDRELANSETKAGTADLNDMPRFELKHGTKGTLRFTKGGKSKSVPFGPLEKEDVTVDAVWND